MKTRINTALMLAIAFMLTGAMMTTAQPAGTPFDVAPSRPKGPCDIYAAAGDPCVAAHSTTRALYASYDGPLYQLKRQSDGRMLNVGVVQPVASPYPDPGGYADAAAQEAFCANTYCWITRIYDQSPNHNDLTQAPRGGFSGPAMGGFNNVPVADMAPVRIMGHKVYGVFIEPGMGLRDDDPKGTAVDDQAEGQYWVVNGQHFNSGCCFDYGNAEIDSRDDNAGTMETAYFGNAPWWYHGNLPGPWVMTDQENNLVGCVNPDGSKLCVELPNITWRFVTAIAKGEPHHWTSMGGNAQEGALSVMFSGPRVGPAYDPMRKQGAILLGNGGDNSNGSQGTFYEGAMTAAGTFPLNATDQLVQANIVAAGYGVLPLTIAPAAASPAASNLQTFAPESSQNVTVTFANTTEAPAANVKMSLSLPNKQWTSFASGTKQTSVTFAGPVAPGARMSATFTVTSGPAAFNGDLIANVSWTDTTNGRRPTLTSSEKVRNVRPVRINEFRISSGPPTNATDSFIELYNAGSRSVDVSNWTLTEHLAQQAIFSTVKIPRQTKLAAGGFYLLGLSNSGLAASAHGGDTTIYVRRTTGMKVGDTISIGTGSSAETRKIASVGTTAENNTTVWQPLPDGPVIKIPAGSTNVPVASVSGFVVGEKIALGYGATYPTVPGGLERYEVATVTDIGKAGTQDYLAANASAGATNIKVASDKNISVGDKIRLDVESVGHGIETVTVAKVGTEASRTTLLADASAGTTDINVRPVHGFAVGDTMTIGTAPHQKTVTVTALNTADTAGIDVSFTPALSQALAKGEEVTDLGTGLDLAAPLRFNHSANLPFSVRGTGITFKPATGFVHLSNEPIQALGTGVTLDKPLAHTHAINEVVRDAAVKNAGYQGMPTPNQWFGGPELTTNVPLFGRTITVREGGIVLRNAEGLVVDSLNYGGLVDPWAAEGYQAASGMDQNGCFVIAPRRANDFGPFTSAAGASNTSAGRFPDGFNTDSNCADFVTSPASVLASASAVGATNIKVTNVAGFDAGQTIRIGTGASLETAVVAAVGSAGATVVRTATAVGATVVPVDRAGSFSPGQTISIGSGTNYETAIVVSTARFREASITVSTPLTLAHAVGAQVSGTGITLTSPLTREHASEVQVTGDRSTPGAPNHYYRKSY